MKRMPEIWKCGDCGKDNLSAVEMIEHKCISDNQKTEGYDQYTRWEKILKFFGFETSKMIDKDTDTLVCCDKEKKWLKKLFGIKDNGDDR